MKKGLFLLPLVGGLLLSGCTFTLFGKEISLFEKKNSNNNNNNNNNNSSTDPTKPTVVDTTPSGSLLATVTMSKNTDLQSSSDDSAVFSKSGYSVTVGKGTNTNQTVQQAVDASGTYEFRVYAYFDLTFAGSSFKQLLIKYSNYKSNDGKTYYFDYDNMTGATCVHDDTKYEALVTFESAQSSYTFNLYHQTRIASVSFYG